MINVKNQKVKYSVIMPAYNEADNLKTLVPYTLDVLRSQNTPFELLLINDGSSDLTGHINKQMANKYPEVRAIEHKINQGKTAAMLTGAKAARSTIVVLFETDWQYEAKDIYLLIKAFQKYDVDIVNGKRKVRADKSHRKVMSRVYNTLNTMFFNSHITDRNSGIKAFKRDVFLSLYQFDHTAFFGMHRVLLTLASEFGYKIIEVPVNHYHRRAGKSYINTHGTIVKTLHDMTKAKLMTTFKFNNGIKLRKQNN